MDKPENAVPQPNIDPVPEAALAQLQPVLEASAAAMGFVPNSMTTMAHMPQLPMAFSMLAGVVFGADLQGLMNNYAQHVPTDAKAAEALTPDQVQLIAYTVSLSAGCRYCQAHTSHNAHRFGLAEEKLNAVLAYETSDLFSASERALIALALACGEVPNGAQPAHFSALREHFSERQVTQIVSVISLFGYLNRWNDTVGTQLESIPVAFADGHLKDWEIGKHG